MERSYTYDVRFASLMLKDARNEFKRHMPLKALKGMTATLQWGSWSNMFYRVEIPVNPYFTGIYDKPFGMDVKAQSASEAKAKAIFSILQVMGVADAMLEEV